MNKVYCYCHFAGVYQCVRTRACVGVNGGWGDGGVSVRVCMCVYMVAILKVSRLAEKKRERERVKFVSIVMWPVTKGLQVRDQC